MRITFSFALAILLTSCSFESDKDQENNTLYEVAKIVTPEGEILFFLHNQTPKHKASFVKLVGERYFDSYTFNRVIENFVAQGGCPDTPEGFSESPYLLEPEFDQDLRHIYGAVGAGRDNNPQMLSAGCKFYIVQNKQGLHRLDDKYTVFGQVLKGMDVVDKIVIAETDSIDQPVSPITFQIEIIKLDSLEISKMIDGGWF